MARHLIAAGHRVHGLDLRPEARELAADTGVRLHSTAREVASTCEVTFVVVGFDEEVLEASSGPEGALSGALPGSILAICSTVRQETVRRIEEAGRERRVSVLDVPLCRSEHAAIAGDLLVMVGGDRDAFRRCEPLLRTFATDICHLGEVGAGQIGKMINNYLLWAAVVADYEGLRLGQALGLDLDPLLEALRLSSGANWALGTWDKGRPMPWAEKDMAILTETAGLAALSLPLADAVKELIAALRATKEEWRLENGVASGGDEDSMSAFMRATDPRSIAHRARG